MVNIMSDSDLDRLIERAKAVRRQLQETLAAKLLTDLQDLDCELASAQELAELWEIFSQDLEDADADFASTAKMMDRLIEIMLEREEEEGPNP